MNGKQRASPTRRVVSRFDLWDSPKTFGLTDDRQYRSSGSVEMEVARSLGAPAHIEGTDVRVVLAAAAVPRYSEQGRTHAFTLIEFLTVVAVLGILAGLLLPALHSARRRAGTTSCLSQIRQLSLAFQAYAIDHADKVPPNRDGEFVPLGETWVEGWLGVPGPDVTNVLYLQRGLLGGYVPNVALWRCPASRPVRFGDFSQVKVRTVSINGFIGSPVRSPAALTYARQSEFARPGPADLFTLIEERAETLNDGAFQLHWDFQEFRPQTWILRDQPAVLHGRAGNLAFGDGHVETHRWQAFEAANPNRDDQPAPNNRDLLWLQQHGTWREARP